MAAHNDLGKLAEGIAEKYFVQNGYEILQRNWTFGKCEIDIIATIRDELHFIEVKSGYFVSGGHPEDNVTSKKFRHLRTAAEEFMYRNPEYTNIRFSVLSITFYRHKEPELFLIEDVFF